MENNTYGYIYGLKSPCNKWYIGQTTQEVYNYIKREYMNNQGGKRKKLNNAIKKYGFSNFEFFVLDTAENKEELNKKEIFFIEKYKGLTEGYNLKEGGTNGKPSLESKIKMRLAKLGKKLTPETKEKMSKTAKLVKRKKHSEDSKQKIRNSLLGKKQSLETSIKKSVSLSGKKRPIEVCKKISDSHKNKVLSDSHKEKIGNSHKGKKLSDETKLKLKESSLLYWKNKKEGII